jgi:adenylylsulfate kinase-like enzyme
VGQGLAASDEEAYAPLAAPKGYTLAPEQQSAGRRKAIVFVTGVPGAGKTLVGLNVATRHGERSDAAHAVFLSGNGPLVAVLREALARDDLDRARPQARRVSLNESRLPRVVC